MKQLFIIQFLALTCSIRVSAQENRPVSAEDLKTWCYYLAGDEMKGRKNGSPEMRMAADYIASCFAQAGLKSFFPEAGYFQEYTIEKKNKEVSERNVIGMIEGSDSVLKKEWIILSAHFDHIGTGMAVNGDSIFNGADDNASGTVTIMGLAKTLGLSMVQPKRSILFVAYSGEEMGMRGSRWMVEHPPIPLDQVKLNLNFEMEGESVTLGKHRYILTGHQFTDFDDLLDEYNKNTDWELAREFKSPPWIFLMSDNAALAIKRDGEKISLNIPAFTIVTTDDMSIIHKVTDEPQFMDYENMASLVAYATGLVLFLATDPLNIHWDYEAFKTFSRQ